ncbi:MAG: hypothetical protein GY765_19105 [bacterium]|nr:hypothetical protein [bacterium]
MNKPFLRFAMESGIRGFPASICNDKFYQIIENDDEEWELHISPIK